ncbi:hypothetical protein FQZ97_902570 [compost metagenome]
MHVPHLLGQCGARQDLATPAREQREQVELLGGEVQPLRAPRAAARDEVHLQVGQAQHGGGLRTGEGAAAQQRAHAREQFGEGEGFDEVVVGPAFEALDAVFDLVACGEHESGRLAVFGAQGGEHAVAVHAGQHHVEQHQVVAAAGGQAAAFDAVARHVHDVAVFTEALVQVLRQFGFIFDDKDTHR